MKQSRHQKIAELVSDLEIETQEELAAHLKAAGFSVTQATVSRDIRQMHLSKVPTAGGRQKYALVKQEEAQNILVLRTVSGMAMAVATAIDALQLKEVVGCIAGDDTIMIAVRSAEETKRLMEQFRELLRR